MSATRGAPAGGSRGWTGSVIVMPPRLAPLASPCPTWPIWAAWRRLRSRAMDHANGRKIATNGIELMVYEAGEHGRPVVLCHGFPELAYSWRHQVQPLADAGHHVIVPDQRG